MKFIAFALFSTGFAKVLWQMNLGGRATVRETIDSSNDLLRMILSFDINCNGNKNHSIAHTIKQIDQVFDNAKKEILTDLNIVYKNKNGTDIEISKESILSEIETLTKEIAHFAKNNKHVKIALLGIASAIFEAVIECLENRDNYKVGNMLYGPGLTSYQK